MQPGPVDQTAVDGAQRAADQHAADQRRKERVNARQHQLGGDHPGEREDRPDRQVDPGDEDREELAHADQHGDRTLDKDLRNVVGRQEVLRRQGAEDGDDDSEDKKVPYLSQNSAKLNGFSRPYRLLLLW